MPTSRPRHTITETDDVANALDDAARRWPAERSRRRQLLLRLVREGHLTIRADREDDKERRRAAIRRTSGTLTDAYDPEYLTRLRDDWPA